MNAPHLGCIWLVRQGAKETYNYLKELVEARHRTVLHHVGHRPPRMEDCKKATYLRLASE